MHFHPCMSKAWCIRESLRGCLPDFFFFHWFKSVQITWFFFLHPSFFSSFFSLLFFLSLNFLMCSFTFCFIFKWLKCQDKLRSLDGSKIAQRGKVIYSDMLFKSHNINKDLRILFRKIMKPPLISNFNFRTLTLNLKGGKVP